MSLTKKIGGAIKDKIVITATRLTDDEVIRAILKVTSHELKAPNEKHMQRLMDASRGQYDQPGKSISMEELVQKIAVRLHVRDWVVVLKTMTTLHILMQEGSASLAEAITRRGKDIFNVRAHLKALADSPEAHCQQRYIRQYGEYLEVRVMATLETKRLEEDMFALDTDWSPSLLPIVLKFLRCWSEAIDALTVIEVERDDLGDNGATVSSLTALVKDCNRIYASFSTRMLWLLKYISQVNPNDCVKILELYEAHCKHIQKINAMFRKIKDFPLLSDTCDPLQELPASTAENLRNACQNIEDPNTKAIPKNISNNQLDIKNTSTLSQPSSAPAAPAPAPAPKSNELDLWQDDDLAPPAPSVAPSNTSASPIKPEVNPPKPKVDDDDPLAFLMN